MTVESIWGGWEQSAAIAVIIAFFITSLGYLLAYFFQHQELKIWAKNEFGQAIASAFAVGGIIGFVHFFSSVSTALTGEVEECTHDCHIIAAQKYLNNTIDGALKEFNSVFALYMWLSIVSSVQFSFATGQPMLPALAFSPLAGLYLLMENIAAGVDILVKLLLVLRFQEIFLEYVHLHLFPLFLVYGVILRTFFFSRKLGGLLIAIAVALYTVYPLSYVLADFIWKSLNANPFMEIDAGDFVILQETIKHPEKEKGFIDSIKNIPYWIGKFLEPVGKAAIITLTSPLYGAVHGLVISVIYDPYTEWFIGEGGMLDSIANLLIYAAFLPFVALFTTIAFVKALSPLLGGDIEIAGITYLI